MTMNFYEILQLQERGLLLSHHGGGGGEASEGGQLLQMEILQQLERADGTAGPR